MRRILSSLATLWLAATLAFFALRLLPGDAIRSQLTESGAPASAIAERRAALGLDDPAHIQYGRYLAALAQGDLGTSLLNGLPVSALLADQLDATLELALAAMIVAVPLGLSLGAGALMAGWGGWLARAALALALSAPIYWTGTLAIYFFTAQLELLPSGGAGRLSQLVLPALVLGYQLAGGIAQVAQAALGEAIPMPHVTTARAKGLGAWRVGLWHLLRPTLPPIVTQIGIQTGFLLSGAVITETIFSRPGVGRLLLDATLRQDYPLVQGVVVWAAAVFIFITLAADMLIALVDPRVRQRA